MLNYITSMKHIRSFNESFEESWDDTHKTGLSEDPDSDWKHLDRSNTTADDLRIGSDVIKLIKNQFHESRPGARTTADIIPGELKKGSGENYQMEIFLERIKGALCRSTAAAGLSAGEEERFIRAGIDKALGLKYKIQSVTFENVAPTPIKGLRSSAKKANIVFAVKKNQSGYYTIINGKKIWASGSGDESSTKNREGGEASGRYSNPDIEAAASELSKPKSGLISKFKSWMK
jgi:hypothetical protein